MEIKGYKAFDAAKNNRYGMPFEEGKDYHIDGDISFGNRGNGFHMCKHLSDVFRFFDPDNVLVASVIGSGICAEGEYEDWSEPYYEMYAVSDIHIEKFLSREEIIELMANASTSDIIKFFATFKPTELEAIQILRGNRGKSDHERALAAFLYYFKGINVYALDLDEKSKILKKVLDDGQDSNQRGQGK